MKRVIKELTDILSVPVLPFETPKIQDCVCYKYYMERNTGAIAQYRLELRIITKTVASAQEIKQKILQALVTVADIEKLGYKKCELNGGGALKDSDTDTIHTLLYFDITTKSEVTI